MLLPLYVFTLVFIVGPLVYMVILSFLQRAETWGVTNQLTLDNYRNILEPVYLQTFVESFKLAIISTVLIILIGYPFGYFMAKLTAKWKKRTMMLLMIPFWTSSLIRLYGWIIIFRANGVFDKLLMGLGITDEPMRLLYTYPAVVVGMIYALLPFMIFAVYSSAEKLDWSLIEAARDLGASRIRAFFTVTLKLTLPGLLSGVILTFIPSMGLFFISDLLGGSKILLIAPPPVKRGAWVPNQQLIDDSRTFAQLCQTLAEHLGIRFADAGKWDIPLAYDGVHFTEQGHKTFAAELLEELK